MLLGQVQQVLKCTRLLYYRNRSRCQRLKTHSQVWDNFWQLKTLYKWWKMLFISCHKLFSFWRYLRFCVDIMVMQENGLIRKIRCLHSSTLGPPNIARTSSWIKHITYSRLYLFKIKHYTYSRYSKNYLKKPSYGVQNQWKAFSSQ